MTARIWAFFLASRDNPHRRLCPHPPIVAPDQLRLDVAELDKLLQLDRVEQRHYMDGKSDSLPEKDRNNGHKPDRHIKSRAVDSSALIARYFLIKEHRKTKKDHKSLTQSLFDTMSILSFEYERFPRLEDVVGGMSGVEGRVATLYRSLRSNHIAAIEPVSEQSVKDLLTRGILSCACMDGLKTLIRSGQGPETSMLTKALHFTLSDAKSLTKSFREETWQDGESSPLSHLDPTRLEHALRSWNSVRPNPIFNSLWLCLEPLFTLPHELSAWKGPRARLHRRTDSPKSKSQADYYLNDSDAAHIVMICIHALTSHVSKGRPRTWKQIRQLRAEGKVIPDARQKWQWSQPDNYQRPWLRIIDELEYEPALRLAKRLVRAIAARKCFTEILKVTSSDKDKNGSLNPVPPQHTDHPECRPSDPLLNILISHLGEVNRQKPTWHKRLKHKSVASKASALEDPGWTVSSVFLEWLRTIVMKEWAGEMELKRWEPAGAAVEMMAHLCK